jgi:hypothetical protein
MTKHETYTKFEDFAQQVKLSKGIGDIYYAPLQKVDWVEKAIVNGTQKVPHLVGSVRLTATDDPDNPLKQRHLNYTELLINDPVDSLEAGKAAGDKFQASIKAMIEKLQDKCPKCRLFEGIVEIKT